jgi:hypothetical protein
MPEDAETYLRQFERDLVKIPSGERDKIVQEIRSHLLDRAQVGPQMLGAAISQLGPPRLLARSFVEDYALQGALKGRTSPLILIAMLPRAIRSLTALAICTAGVVLYAFTFAFVFIAAWKPISPEHVGVWRDASGRIADGGVIYGMPHTMPEVLGWWIIPISLAAGAATYVLASLLMRWGGRLLLRRR